MLRRIYSKNGYNLNFVSYLLVMVALLIPTFFKQDDN